MQPATAAKLRAFAVAVGGVVAASLVSVIPPPRAASPARVVGEIVAGPLFAWFDAVSYHHGSLPAEVVGFLVFASLTAGVPLTIFARSGSRAALVVGAVAWWFWGWYAVVGSWI